MYVLEFSPGEGIGHWIGGVKIGQDFGLAFWNAVTALKWSGQCIHCTANLAWERE